MFKPTTVSINPCLNSNNEKRTSKRINTAGVRSFSNETYHRTHNINKHTQRDKEILTSIPLITCVWCHGVGWHHIDSSNSGSCAAVHHGNNRNKTFTLAIRVFLNGMDRVRGCRDVCICSDAVFDGEDFIIEWWLCGDDTNKKQQTTIDLFDKSIRGTFEFWMRGGCLFFIDECMYTIVFLSV